MKILNPITVDQLPHPGVRAYSVSNSNKGTVARSKHAHKSPRSTIAPPAQILAFGQSWPKWRRKWYALIAAIWKHTLSPADITWWETQAALVPYKNYQNVTGRNRPFYFFMWYQMRWFDLHIDRYLPFPANAADFPHKFATPWTNPALEPPTIVSATVPGTVIVRCLNVAPDGNTLEPESCFSLHPPMGTDFPIGQHPWYSTSRSDDGDHSEFTYELSLMFPRLKHGSRAALIHRYCLRGNPYVGIERDPATADDLPAAPPYPWLTPNNALALDNVYTQATIPLGPATTDKLELTNLSNPVPTNANILGIQVAIWRRDQTLGSTDLHCALTYSGGLETAADYNPNRWSYGRELVSFGSDADLWGRTWTPTELNAADFGIHLWEEFTAGAGGTPEIDWATIFLYYSISADWFTDPSLTTFEWL